MPADEDGIDRGAFLLVAGLLGLIALQTFFPLLQVGLITNDDLKLRNAALDHGFPGVASVLWAFTRQHGRLDIAQILSWYLPFRLDSFVYFKVITLAAIAADLLLFAYFARSVFRSRRAFLLALLLSLVGLQNSWEHSPLTAFPGLFTFTFAYLLGSFLAFQWFLDRGGRAGLVSAALFLLCLCSYEVYVLYTPVFLGLALLAGRPPRQALRSITLHVAAVGLYLALYFTSHFLRTGNYPGITLSSALDLPRIAGVTWQLSVSSLPTYFFFSPKYVYLLHSYQKTFGVAGLLGTLTAGSLIKAALVGGVYGFLMARGAGARTRLEPRRLVAIAAAAAGYFFAPPFLPALTELYQQESPEQLGMQCSYFSQFAWICFAVSLLLLATRVGRWGRGIFTAVSGLALMFASLAIDYTNSAVADWQGRGQDRFDMIDAFIASPDYATIPTGSILYAPTLWSTNGTLDFGGAAIDPRPSPDGKYENFWTFYFSHRGRKSVIVANRLERIPDGWPGFFYLRHVQPRHTRSQYLVFAWVEKSSKTLDDLGSAWVWVYDRSSWTSKVIGGSLRAPEPSKATVRLIGRPPVETKAQFTFDVGRHFRRLGGGTEMCALATDDGLIDADSVFLAGSAPATSRAATATGWYDDGWIGAEAHVPLLTQGPARVFVTGFAPDYIFTKAHIGEVTVTLEMDGEVMATQRLSQGGPLKLQVEVPRATEGTLVIRCGPTHSPKAVGASADDVRRICLVVDRVKLRTPEPEL
jgi:hypothetical protein